MKVLKEIVGYLFILAIFTVILGTVIWMYVNFFHSSDKIEAEHFVLEKQSEKGMFLAPRYTVITDDSKVGNYVTKKEFDDIEIGDVIEGHKTFEYGFFTKMDHIYEGAVLIFLIVLIGFMFIFILVTLILSIPPIKEALDRREKGQPQKKRKSIIGWGILTILLLASITYMSLYTLNLFHKLVPINQTATTGLIIDRDYDLNIKAQADYSKYELTIEFTAEDGGEYQVQKGVTRATYDLYKYENLIICITKL